jgi:hypothetical protein
VESEPSFVVRASRLHGMLKWADAGETPAPQKRAFDFYLVFNV